MKRLTLGLILSLLFLPSLTMSAAPQTADEIIEKHLAALGGRDALAKLTSRKAVGTITLSTEAGDLSGPVETYSKAPNKARLLLNIDLTPVGMSETMTIDQRFDGTAGWTLNSLQGDMEITGDQLASMRNNAFPTPLLTYKDRGTKIEALPKDTVGGREVIVLQITPETGPASKVYLDPETYLVIKSVGKVNSPEFGEMEQTSTPSDYRTVDGVRVAFKVVNSSPIQTVTITLTSVEHNVAIDDALFRVK